MKKLMSIFAACLFVFALSSCGAEGDASAEGSEAEGSAEAPAASE